MILRPVTIFILALLCLNIAHAMPSASPLLFEIGSLPRGRFMISFVQFESSIESHYKNQGEKASIAEEFNRGLTWNDLANDDADRELQLRGLLDSKSISNDSSAGRIVGDFKGDVQGKVPVIGWGITDHLNLIASTSFINFKAESNLAYQASPESSRLIQTLLDSGMKAAANDLAQSLNQSPEDRLEKAGYDYRRSVRRSAQGDTRLELAWTPKSHIKNWSWQVSPAVVIPTGKTAQVNDIYGFSTGEGRWSWGARSAASYQMNRRWKSQFGWAFLIPQNTERTYRIPTEPGDRLSSDIDSSVGVRGGWQSAFNFHQSFQLSRSWGLLAGVERSYRHSLTFSGKQWAAERYQWIEDRPTQVLDALTLQVRFNSIEAFLAQEFLIPTQISLGAGIPIGGKNSSSNSVIALNGSVFF